MTKEAISREALEANKLLYAGLGQAPERRALVIGSNECGNIGSAITTSFREDGYHVSEEDIDSFNVAKPSEVRAREWGEFDTLVLANGSTHLDWIEDQPMEAIGEVVSNVLLGSIYATREFVRDTMAHPHLKYIVYIGSMAHSSPLNASAPYCAAKAGLHHFARCAGWELTPKGYRVFIVHPSNVWWTPMTEDTIEGIARYRGISYPEAEEYWGALNLMDRWLSPEDIARTVTWLTSGLVDYLSGTAIEMTGGQR